MEALERAIANNFGKADHTLSRVWYYQQFTMWITI